MEKDLLTQILFKILFGKTVYYSINYLRLSGYSKMRKQYSHALINQVRFKLHLMNILIPYTNT